jgi:small neutral amino acid transporter SnatA (MarC family)
MIDRSIRSKLAHARYVYYLALGLGLLVLSSFVSPALAQTEIAGRLNEPNVSARKIFIMLFLMLGPIKILVPFVNLTRNADPVLRRRLATRAILFSMAALALAGVLGRNILENFEISVPVLALTGGLILFLVALRTVLEQSTPQTRLKQDPLSPGTDLALSPLAFPVIVTPYGIAAVIVFATLAQDDISAKLMIASIVLLILLLDWVAMLFAGAILEWTGTALQVFTVVLGVTQIALGLQIITHSLSMIGVFVERTY